VSALRDAIDGDERSPDVTARIAAEREDRTRARDLELSPSARRGLEANDEHARTVTNPRDGVAIASLLDRHRVLARHLRPALAAVRREAMREAPAQRRRTKKGHRHDGALSRASCHVRDRAIPRG